MTRDSGSERPQRTVAELLAEYGAAGGEAPRRRRRRPDDDENSAPQTIIERVLSDSGKLLPIRDDQPPEPPRTGRRGGDHRPVGPQQPQPPRQQPPPQQQPPTAYGEPVRQPLGPPTGRGLPPTSPPMPSGPPPGQPMPSQPMPSQPMPAGPPSGQSMPPGSRSGMPPVRPATQPVAQPPSRPAMKPVGPPTQQPLSRPGVSPVGRPPAGPPPMAARPPRPLDDDDLATAINPPLPPDDFDIITLFHVLEHVPDPRMLIDRCQAILKPSGMLLVAVPNDVLAWSSKIKKSGKRLGLGPFQKFSPVLGISRAGASREIHLSHFTPSVLRQLLESCGLPVVEESLDPYYVSSGVRLFLDSAYYALHRALYAMLKINRYDTIWMVARKP